jgi:hypothetical protein
VHPYFNTLAYLPSQTNAIRTPIVKFTTQIDRDQIKFADYTNSVTQDYSTCHDLLFTNLWPRNNSRVATASRLRSSDRDAVAARECVLRSRDAVAARECVVLARRQIRALPRMHGCCFCKNK